MEQMTAEVASVNNVLLGRQTIYAVSDEINADNVLKVLNAALAIHIQNLYQEEYLYWYRRGLQPVLTRTKERNSFITNRIIENHADEIVSFKCGYFLSEPASYVSRTDGGQNKVDTLNEYLYRSGKHAADNALVDWFHTVGVAPLLVSYTNDAECPAKAYALDPRGAFVVYSAAPGNEPVMGVSIVTRGDALHFDVYTRDEIFHLRGTKSGETITNDPKYIATATSLDSVERNLLGEIPIIEYHYNSVKMGAFENVLSLLDGINDIESNRADSVGQFVQSLLVGVNIDFEETPSADEIRRTGMITFKSNDGNKADFKILSEELDQTQTQVFVDNLYSQALRICAMPSVTRQGTSIANASGSAALATDGWYQCEASARNTEDLFVNANRRFDKIFVKCLELAGVLEIDTNDFELNIIRNDTQNIQSKAQSFHTLMSAGLHPELAAKKSGVSSDPIADIKYSEKYLNMIWGDPDAPKEEPTATEEIIVEDETSEGKENALIASD